MQRFTTADFDAALSLVDTLPIDPVSRLESLGLPGRRVMHYSRIQAGNVSEVLRSEHVAPEDAYALGWLDALVVGVTLATQREGHE